MTDDARIIREILAASGVNLRSPDRALHVSHAGRVVLWAYIEPLVGWRKKGVPHENPHNKCKELTDKMNAAGASVGAIEYGVSSTMGEYLRISLLKGDEVTDDERHRVRAE